MKFKTKTKNANDETVYEFIVGQQELVLLGDLIKDCQKRTLVTTETHPTRSRLRNMRNHIEKALSDSNLK